MSFNAENEFLVFWRKYMAGIDVAGLYIFSGITRLGVEVPAASSRLFQSIKYGIWVKSIL